MNKGTYSSNNNTIQFCSLGSGSKGNATLVAIGETIILIDCGFSIKETVRRLILKAIFPEQISAILVTHEHADHIGGVAGFSNKYSIPVWINKGTSLHKKCETIQSKVLFNSHQPFQLKDFWITPVAVPHDSREATQFIISTPTQSLGLLTDVGHITSHIINAYSICDALLLEFNYEHQLLMQGSYPYSLKKRVSGGLGHLSNQQAIEMLENMGLEKLQMIVAMHMSEENNDDRLVSDMLRKLTENRAVSHLLANQSEGIDWQEIS